MSNAMVIIGGVFIVGRTLEADKEKVGAHWEFYDVGFPTREEAQAFIDAQPPSEYFYTVVDSSQIEVSPTTMY